MTAKTNATTPPNTRVRSGFAFSLPVEMELTVDGRKQTREFARRDQFGPELLYFSDCILRNREPEPSGPEGLIDVRIIEALYHSAKTSRPVKLPKLRKAKRPSLGQEIRRPRIQKPKLIHAKSASED